MALTMSERIRQQREQLLKRTEESYKRKESFGPEYTIFKKDIQVQFWVPKAGVHVIDIVPFIVGDKMPIEAGVKEGDLAYVLDIWVHRRVGVNDAQFVCMAKNYNLRCPICEHQRELKKEDEYDADLVKSLYPSRRVVYNILCYDSDEELKKDIQVFEIAHWYMEKHLVPLALDNRTKQFLPFADPFNGKSIQFECKQTTFEIKKADGKSDKGKGMDFFAHKFLDRDYELADEYLNMAHQLDQLVHLPEYEEVYESYWGEAPVKEESKETTTTVRPRGRGAVQHPEDKPQAAAGPTTRRLRPGAQAANAGTEESAQCPHEGKWGEDIDQLAECQQCDVYDKCATRSDELKASGQGKVTGDSEDKKPPEPAKDQPQTPRVRRPVSQ
jgi:gp32 DNA binding protein like